MWCFLSYAGKGDFIFVRLRKKYFKKLFFPFSFPKEKALAYIFLFSSNLRKHSSVLLLLLASLHDKFVSIQFVMFCNYSTMGLVLGEDCLNFRGEKKKSGWINLGKTRKWIVCEEVGVLASWVSRKSERVALKVFSPIYLLSEFCRTWYLLKILPWSS